jgi:hypothetical protein
MQFDFLQCHNLARGFVYCLRADSHTYDEYMKKEQTNTDAYESIFTRRYVHLMLYVHEPYTQFRMYLHPVCANADTYFFR